MALGELDAMVEQIGHVAFVEGLVNRLQRAEDQQAVLHGARMMYKLYGDVFRSLPHGSALFEQAA